MGRVLVRLSRRERAVSADRLHEVLVLLFRHEALELALILHADLEEPAAAGRILVDGAGRALEVAVDLDDLAGDRRVDLARGLDALDHGGLGALGDRLADGRKLDIDHIAELALRVVGDADDAGVALEADIFVVLGVARRHGSPPCVSACSGAARRASARPAPAGPCRAPSGAAPSRAQTHPVPRSPWRPVR